MFKFPKHNKILRSVDGYEVTEVATFYFYDLPQLFFIKRLTTLYDGRPDTVDLFNLEEKYLIRFICLKSN